MIKTSIKKNETSVRSVNITITGKVVETAKGYGKNIRPYLSVKEYAIFKDESEKTYDILGYGEKSVKEFNII
jgi:hypothetical protein